MSSHIATKIITVTPATADGYIKGMVHNRPARTKHITFLAGAMRRGEWALSGQPVIFASAADGRGGPRMIDGQHRMRAVVASGVTVQMLAVFGVDESMYNKMDMAASRSIGDCIVTANRTAVARVISLLHAESVVRSGSLIGNNNVRPTNLQATQILERHPGIVECASILSGLRRAKRMIGHGSAAYCLYRMRGDNAALAGTFFEQVNSGVGLSSKSSTLSLRNLLSDGRRVDGVMEAMTRPDVVPLVALAWYNTLDGKHTKVSAKRAREVWAGWRSQL